MQPILLSKETSSTNAENFRRDRFKQNNLVIRVLMPDDERGAWEVLKDGSFSNVPVSFLKALQKKKTTALILVAGSFVLGYTGYFFAGLLTVAVCLCLIYCCLWLVAIFYVYGPPLNDMKEVTKNYLSDEDCNFWVAELDGKIVGTIAIVKQVYDCNSKQDSESNLSSTVAWLRRMAVLREYRGCGVAKSLIGTAIDFCGSRNYNKIELITTDAHQAARKLYQKCGFVCRAFRPYKYIYGFVTIWTYEYELNLS